MSDELRDAAAQAFRAGFDGVIRLEPADGAPLWIDGRQEKPRFSAERPKGAPDSGVGLCVWRASPDTLAGICVGERLLGVSYLSGRLAIAGDMSVMARLVMERPSRG